MSRIEVRFATYDRQNSGPFTFSLRTPDGKTLIAITHDASTVKPLAYHVFEFPPLDHSAGQRYQFCLEAPLAELVSAVTAVGFLAETYPEGQAMLTDIWGDAAGVKDLDFRIGYTPSGRERLRILASRLAHNKPFWTGRGSFYALLAILYLSLLYVLFFKLARLKTSNQNDHLTPQD